MSPGHASMAARQVGRVTGRLTIFAKGNADVRDVLVAQRSGGAVAWNGINETLRDRHPGWKARVRHETLTRSDALLALDGTVPDALATQCLSLGAYPLVSQFGSALFDASDAVVILSIQADVMTRLARHRGDGHLFYPAGVDGWGAAERQWLTEHYAPAPPLEPAASMANFEQVIARLRHGGTTRILILNLSPIVPWERVHNHHGLAERLSDRIRRFNLALVDLSRRTGVSIVDVDEVLARNGADRLKVDAVHLNAEGCRLVAEEVVRILDDLGCFAGEAAG
jgi:hypothetical protein